MTIHKRLNPNPAVKTSHGEALREDDVPGTPLNGVTFKIERVRSVDNVNLDVTTKAGFDKAVDFAKKHEDGDKANAVFDTGKQQTTADNGVTKFTNLNLGLYRVEETDFRKEDLPEGTDPASVKKAAPFYVMIPMTSVDKKTWNYDVHVYPKNYSAQKPVKKVQDAGKQAGNTITYTLEATPKALKPETTRAKFWIRDKYTNARLADVKITSVVQGDEVIEYTLDRSNLNDGEFIVKVNQPNALTAGKPVIVTVTAKVTPMGESNGVIVNEVAQWDRQSDEGQEEEPEWIPGNKVVTYYGKVKVIKTDANAEEPKKNLQGAKFALYYSDKEQNGLNAKNIDSVNGVTRVTVNNVNEWTTGSDGTITIAGLHVTDYADNVAISNPKGKYYLVETEAPAGYVKSDKVYDFTLERTSKEALDSIADFETIKAASADGPG